MIPGIKDNRKPNIIVCGDIMLDINTYVDIAKIANEAPIPVYNFKRTEYKLGGCGNVMQNLYNIGCENLFIFGSIGNDTNGNHINTIISNMNIHNYLQTVEGINTITKHRYYCNNKILFRCDNENNTSEKKIVSSVSFIEDMERCIQTYSIDCIILSDYNKGSLSYAQCQRIITLANKYNIVTCVDPKDDYMKYKGCTLIKPNHSEACSLFNVHKDTPIEEIHTIIFNTIECKYSVITMSENGITLYDGSNIIYEKPEVRSIIDVTGAGDVVCSIFGYFLTSSVSLRNIVKIATDVATLSVGYPGVYAIQKSDILRTLIFKKKIVTFDDLEILKHVHADRKIVFTNGCFDILHFAHIQLLKFCKEKADILIVGINSDSSIKRLKGSSRPIQNEQLRVEIISSLEYVDYVIMFEENTPQNILQELTPDILVKGGDYTIDKIVGREHAGETIIFNYVEGISTTSTIQRIQEAASGV